VDSVNLAQVLYTYFRIVNDVVDFYSGTWVRSGAYTVSDLSAAHFEGKFWLAFKTFESGDDVAWTSAPSWSSWSNVAELGRGDVVVDAPTWSYSPSDSKERALIWTETMDY
jgi:hypothetical protein